jgi:CBS domain-containing protein
MNAADVMTLNVISIEQGASIGDAIRLMLDHHISGLPVVDGSGKLVGILTEGDLLRRAETRTERQRPRWIELLRGPGRLAEDYVHTHGRKVGEVMTEAVVSVSEDASLAEVVRLMERHNIKRLPVLRGNALVGIVSRADLMRALAGLVQEETLLASPLSDDEIGKDVLASLAETVWAPRAGIRIAVTDGAVTLAGAITDEKQREALHIAVENVPGVKRVRDRIVWVEPISGTVFGAPADELAPSTPSEE